MNKYILGNKIIEATEERYNNNFKDIGYVPYVERKEETETTREVKNGGVYNGVYKTILDI